MVCAETVAEAFDAMYYLEQAARVTVKAMSTGRPLKIVPAAVRFPSSSAHYVDTWASSTLRLEKTGP